MLKTNTGRYFDYTNITKDSIYIPDILTSLPSINRFLGHSLRPYSVGEHTLLGLIISEDLGYTPLQQLYWFIHDFTEAYVGDCPSPLKKLLSNFSEIEREVELAILEHLGLEEPTEEEYMLIKKIDMTMLVLEMRDLTSHNYEDYYGNENEIYFDILEKYSIKDLFESHDDLRKILTYCFNKLMKDVKGGDFECIEI